MNSHQDNGFKAKRITRRYEQVIEAEPSKVFPLICPVKEAEWLDGWDYDLIYSDSGYAEEGCVFISRQEGENDTIWLMNRHDPENRIVEFARITPGSRATRLIVSIEEGEGNTSRVMITYIITALSEEGNRFIDELTEEKFNASMAFWEKSMNYYIKTGDRLAG